ncbi:hypothetical protein HN011_004145 [Eciton burchellii]|nr:hypothetical protein HN011_004145 [Eciton burchellii]
MPTYEMPLIIRMMKKTQLVATLKRTSSIIFNTGGFIRNIENWGVKHLPFKIRVHGQVHTEANHFFLRFDIPPTELKKIVDEYQRDVDIVRLKIYQENKGNKIRCTFDEEMLPPPYRPDVQKLMKKANKSKTNKFKYNSGLDYYPFNK